MAFFKDTSRPYLTTKGAKFAKKDKNMTKPILRFDLSVFLVVNRT